MYHGRSVVAGDACLGEFRCGGCVCGTVFYKMNVRWCVFVSLRGVVCLGVRLSVYICLSKSIFGSLSLCVSVCLSLRARHVCMCEYLCAPSLGDGDRVVILGLVAHDRAAATLPRWHVDSIYPFGAMLMVCRCSLLEHCSPEQCWSSFHSPPRQIRPKSNKVVSEFGAIRPSWGNGWPKSAQSWPEQFPAAHIWGEGVEQLRGHWNTPSWVSSTHHGPMPL